MHNDTTVDPLESRVTRNKGWDSIPIWGTVSLKLMELGRSNLTRRYQVAMNKNSDPMQKFFLTSGWEDGAAPTQIFQTPRIIRNESS